MVTHGVQLTALFPYGLGAANRKVAVPSVRRAVVRTAPKTYPRPRERTVMPIGRLHHTILDCPDPHAVAQFYSALLGRPITYADDDFVVVAPNDHTSGLAFQRAPDHRPPTWPDPAVPQQIHFDVMVDDLPAAAEAVRALGATAVPEGDHVFTDPAGHPFCLIPRPGWAPPVS
jgi:catechol 2,3-dioxygenase-like lactoylglutathione lyase family enzyme